MPANGRPVILGPDGQPWRQSGHRLREQLEQTRKQVAHLKHRLKESYEAWEWLSGYSDMLDRMRGPDRDLLLPVSTANDRRYGDNFPFWRSWVEHSRLRAASRLLYLLSPLARGALSGLAAYVVGKGMHSRVALRQHDGPRPLAAAVQEWLDEWERCNGWLSLQRELFIRSRRDGEYFLRLFPQPDGMTLVRIMEPEWIVEPPNQPRDIASYGIVVDPEDLWDVRGYHVAYDGIASNGEYVSRHLMQHLKVNVDRQIKRGLPDLAYDCLDWYKTAGRLIENMGQGAAIQAAIAFVRQHEAASSSAVGDFAGGLADYQETVPFTGQSRGVQRFEAGTVIDMDSGQTFVETSFGANVGNYVEAAQALLRGIAVQWNAPEWIVSAKNDSVNYASSLTAESPFVKTCEAVQQEHQEVFLWAVRESLKHHCRKRGGFKAGGKYYSWEMVRDLVNLQVVPPRVQTRNRQEDATVNKTLIELGIKSRQTVALEEELDWEQEDRNNVEYEQTHGQSGGPDGGSGGEGGQPDLQAMMGQIQEAQKTLATQLRLLEACIPNRTGRGHHDSETGHPCKPGEEGGSGKVDATPDKARAAPKRARDKEKEQPASQGGDVDWSQVAPHRPTRPEERNPHYQLPSLPWKPPPPPKGKKGGGAPVRGKGAESQTVLGDTAEELATAIGLRSVLPEGQRSYKPGEVAERGSSIDREFDHSGKLVELKMCRTTATEYRLKAKKAEKDAKLKAAELAQADIVTCVPVWDVDANEIHYYWHEGLTGSGVPLGDSQGGWHYAGTVKIPSKEG